MQKKGIANNNSIFLFEAARLAQAPDTNTIFIDDITTSNVAQGRIWEKKVAGLPLSYVVTALTHSADNVPLTITSHFCIAFLL